MFETLELGEIVMIAIFALLCCGICMGAGFELGKQWESQPNCPAVRVTMDAPEAQAQTASSCDQCFRDYNNSRQFGKKVMATELGLVK
jgi:hypothetical protein